MTTSSSNLKRSRQQRRAVWQPPIAIGSPRLAIEIDKNACTGCNLCVLACPTNCLELDVSVKVAYVVRLDACIVCHSCEVVCKPDCLHVQLDTAV